MFACFPIYIASIWKTMYFHVAVVIYNFRVYIDRAYPLSMRSPMKKHRGFPKMGGVPQSGLYCIIREKHIPTLMICRYPLSRKTGRCLGRETKSRWNIAQIAVRVLRDLDILEESHGYDPNAPKPWENGGLMEC